MRVGLDTRGDPNQDRRPDAPAVGVAQAAEPGDLVKRVHDDAAHSDLERSRQLSLGLVIAVEDEAGCRHTGGKRHLQLASGRDI